MKKAIIEALFPIAKSALESYLKEREQHVPTELAAKIDKLVSDIEDVLYQLADTYVQ